MPIMTPSISYQPRFPFRNGHTSTIYPFFFRKYEQDLTYTRKRYTTPDDDFVDVDEMLAGHSKAVLILHGLEGSSSSQYIKGLAPYLHNQGWDIWAINHRSCSGEMNKQLAMYHSGFTDDIAMIFDIMSKQYNTITGVGFSLGGNMLLKYLGEYKHVIPPNFKVGIACSVPTDLAGGSERLKKWDNTGYTRRFLKSLSKKMVIKHNTHPQIDLTHLPKLKELMDFDNYYTASLHGFKDAQDYYDKCNSKQFLLAIKTPAVLINALNDPFLSASCHPFDEAKESSYFHFLPIEHGGHVGFASYGEKVYWTDKTIGNLLKEFS